MFGELPLIEDSQDTSFESRSGANQGVNDSQWYLPLICGNCCTFKAYVRHFYRSICRVEGSRTIEIARPWRRAWGWKEAWTDGLIEAVEGIWGDGGRRCRASGGARDTGGNSGGSIWTWRGRKAIVDDRFGASWGSKGLRRWSIKDWRTPRIRSRVW